VGLTIALAAVLHAFALWQMPQGGSVSLSMLPLFVLALVRGPVIGVVGGALFGIVDFIMEPYVFHWAQVLLDYPVAFGLCGLAGVVTVALATRLDAGGRSGTVWALIVAGVAVGAVGRYAAHVLSGVVFFASYAQELGQAPVWYSLAYNSFVLVSAVACAPIAALIVPRLWPFVKVEVSR
jgi:thiamine transporter